MMIAHTIAVILAILVGTIIIREGLKTMSEALARLTADVADEEAPAPEGGQEDEQQV